MRCLTASTPTILQMVKRYAPAKGVATLIILHPCGYFGCVLLLGVCQRRRLVSLLLDGNHAPSRWVVPTHLASQDSHQGDLIEGRPIWEVEGDPHEGGAKVERDGQLPIRASG